MPILTMAIAAMETAMLKSKFRGCLLGALVGDCSGSPYEGNTMTSGDKLVLQRYFNTLEKPDLRIPKKQYTDDTAMMRSVAKFLIDKPEPDYKFLARLFTNEFFRKPKRGYGEGVVEVFHKLRSSKFEDVFKPAEEQFGGTGSFGNGGAMRIAPIALYFYDDPKMMVEVAKQATKLTHTNLTAINGAILQCLAIQQALLSDPKTPIIPTNFCKELYNKIKKIESAYDEHDEDLDPYHKFYQEKMIIIDKLMEMSHDDDFDEQVIYTLGNGIAATESVPTAIFCFLKAQKQVPRIETDNIYRRTIQYAISMGGDTDTIACMAGAIAGAYLGADAINPNLLKQCEANEEITEMADNLLLARDGPSDDVRLPINGYGEV